MASLQFRTWEQAVEAFDNADGLGWSIWDGKNLMYKGVGSDDLTGWMQLLAKNDTDATYTLRYYEDIDDKKQIKSTTPHDGSFNFKVNSPAFAERREKFSEGRNELYSRIGAMENTMARIAERLDEEPDDAPETSGRLGLIGEILGHPTISALLPQLLSVMMGTGKQGTQLPMARPAMVAAVGNVPDLLTQSIDKLKSVDPKLDEHLAKLAELSEKDPITFQTVMSMLENYKFNS